MTFALVGQAAAVPSAPFINMGNATSSSLQVNLLTKSVESVFGIASYSLYRTTNLASWSNTPIATGPDTMFPYTDTGLSSSTSYWYRVQALGASPNHYFSVFSNIGGLATLGSSGGGGGGSGSTLLSFIKSTLPNRLPGQTLDWFVDGAAQFTNVFSGTAPNYTVGTTGLMVPIINPWTTAANIPGDPNSPGTHAPYLAGINAFIAQNGIVQMALSPDNPAGVPGDGGVLSSNSGQIAGRGNPFPAILQAGSSTQNTYLSYLGTVAAFYRQIIGPFIIAPLGEMNGSNQFWNSANPFNKGSNTIYCTSAQYIQLWQLTYNYLVNVEGITNALWLYEPGTEYIPQSNGTIVANFPGTAYCDLVGLDCNVFPAYDGGITTSMAALTQSYNALASLGPPVWGGDSVGFNTSGGDFYTGIAQVITTNFPKWIAAVYWSQPGLGHDGASDNTNCLTSPWLDLTKMPNDLGTRQAGGVAQSGLSPPAQASAAGYNALTFNSTKYDNVNGPWYQNNFYGTVESSGSIIQNSDGSLDLGRNANNTWGVSTAQKKSGTAHGWNGLAFGGGGYFEATIQFSGTAHEANWWANDVESQSGGYLPMHRWIEIDDIETNTGSSTTYGQAIHDWSNPNGINQSPGNVNTQPNISSPVSLPSGSTLTGTHRYGWLWILATATTNGSITFFFDGQQIGTPCTYRLYNASTDNGTVSGNAIGNVIDTRHMYLIMSGITTNWEHVTSVKAWQKSNAKNITQ